MNRLINTLRISFAIFRMDVLRLSRSMVAVLCVLALIVVPCLYAWFNIFSNWDPYVPESTGNFKIAIVSEDTGTDLLGVHYNVGQLIIDKVLTVELIDFQFPETTEDMLRGVESGEYYAALLIPEDFSSRLLGFTEGDVNTVKIQYYENQKANAVASRVTARATEIAENYINSSFLSTLVEKLSTFSAAFTTAGVSPTDSLDQLDTKLENIKSDLTTYVAIMKSLSSVTNTASSVAGMVNELVPEVLQLLLNSRSSISNMQDRLAAGKQDIIYASDAIRNSSEALRNTVEKLDEMSGGDVASGLGGAYVDWTGLANEGGLTNYEGEIIDSLYQDVNKQLHDNVIAFDDILQQSNIDSNLVASMTTLQESLQNIDGIIGQIEDGINDASVSMMYYSAAVQSCAASIEGTIGTMENMIASIKAMQTNINEIRSSDAFTQLMDLLTNDVDGLIEYLSSPANVETVRVYAVDTWGSGMAPYYTMLSLYACSLLTGTMLKARVKRKGALAEITDSEAFFGRFWIFFTICQLSALLTALGNIYYVGMQCYNPLLFWLACAVTSTLFTAINYGLIFALGNTGEVVSIIILVIQVAGSGGTYPVEMLPKFFRSLYALMPFNYAMTALRECIGGMHGSEYLRCILILILMTAIMIPLALIIHKLNRKSLEKFEANKAETGILH